MTETVDIVTLVEDSPLTILGEVDYQSKLVDKLRNKFSTDEERLFLTSFYTYLNYGPNDFVIELRKVWKWLGFGRINEAKRLLVKEFQVDKDYKNLTVPKRGVRSHGGHLREDTFLTVRCFKKFCLKARTKKADEIHDYYINLEESVQELLEEETTILNRVLTVKNKQIAQMSKKRAFGKTKGSFVYVYKQNINNKDEHIYKIGKTTDLTQRQSAFLRNNFHGQIVYSKSTINNDLAEKVIHHILDKYRTINDREWFEADYKIIIDAVDSSCEFLDKDNFTDLPKKESVPPKPIPKSTPPKLEDKTKLNFNKFINECCTIGEKEFCIKKELFGRFKLWARTNSLKTKETVRLYFDKEYKVGKHYFENYNSTLAIYNGISLKPLTFQKTGIENIDKFVEKWCTTGPVCRIDSKTLEKKFTEECPNTSIEELRNQLGNQFYPSCVYVKNKSLYGYWGIQLKNSEILGLKKSKNLRKIVQCFNEETGKIEYEFGSVTETGKHFKIHPSNISMDIKYNRIRNGFILKFKPC